MIVLSNSEVSNAESTYLVSNTPSFIVRKFKSDPAVRRLAQQIPAADLELEFRKRVSKKPSTLSEVVIPFILAGALEAKAAYKQIKAISDLNLKDFPALKEYLSLLLASPKNSVTVSFSVPPDSVSYETDLKKTSSGSRSVVVEMGTPK